ncbi:unnamed protein product [Auanema sp. JU1783]|nr:unnamed protein product [Auanema sp. JU1783]
MEEEKPQTVPTSKVETLPPITGATNPLKKKIDKLVASRLHNDTEFLQMVDYISPMVDDIDMHTERRLLRKLEQKEVDLNKDYLKEFEKMNSYVQDFADKVRRMHSICSDLTSRIQQNKEKTQDLLSKTSALQSQKRHLETKQKNIDEFLGKFSLTEAESKALEGNITDGTVTTDFFPALNRVKEIYSQSKNLLRSSGEHSAALEVMEDMSQKMEKAYEVLYRSIQRECRVLNMDYIELKHILCLSFAALQDREVLLKYSLDEFCTARKNQILRHYIDALTKGAHGGGKPIELMSHDPQRYLGDMLAWIYEAIEGERELLQMLLKECKEEVYKDSFTHVLSEISSALCRPFKIRVEQALANETDSVVLYSLSALFTFYAGKIIPDIGSESEIAHTISELNNLTLNIFHTSLNNSVQRILAKMGAPDYDLLPVQAVHQILMLLREVLETHDGSMVGHNDSKEEFNKIFSCVLDPLYRAIQIATTQLHSPLDVAVYTLNCLSSIQSAVILYQFTDTRLEMIKALMEANEDVLVSEEASAILASTGLIHIYTKAAAHDPNQGPLSAISGMDSATVVKTFTAFDSFLGQPDSCRLDQVSKISSSRVRDSVRKRTMENVIGAYAVIIRKIEETSNKYENIAYKSVEQVSELLL